MKIVVTIGGSIIIKDHDYKKFRGLRRSSA